MPVLAPARQIIGGPTGVTVEISTGTDKLVVRCQDGVGELTLNNPTRRNALSRDMLLAIPAAIDDLVRYDARVIVLRGAGGEAFASGADLAELDRAPLGSAERGEYERLYHDCLAAVRDVELPVVALIDGYCLGGGVQLALTADLRYATPRSVFGIPAARIGLAYQNVDGLAALIGPGHAAELLFTARTVDGEEALRIGLVNALFPADRIAAEVLGGIARGIAANAPLALRATKIALRELRKPADQRDAAAVRAAGRVCAVSSDLAEGRAALKEKRAPRFTGR